EAYFFFWPGGPMKYHIPWNDNIHYARVIEGLFMNGHESRYNLEYYFFPEKDKAITFYHYYELWLSAIFCEFFQESALIALLAISTPLFSIVVLAGIMGYVEKTNLPIILGLVVAFALLFVQGIFLEIYRDLGFLAYTEDLHSNLMSAIAKRNAPYYVFAIGFWLLIDKRLFKDASVLILSLSLATITALPSVVSGIILSSIILWRIGIYKRNDLIDFSLYVGVLIFSILVFNYLYVLKTTNEISISFLYERLLRFEAIRTKINLFIGLFIQMAVLYLPWFAVLIFFLNELRKNIILNGFILLLSISFSGAFFWTILSPEINVFQFFVHTTSSLLNLFLIIQLIQCLANYRHSLRKTTQMILLLVFCTLLFLNVERAYRTQRYIYTFDTEFSNEYLDNITKKYNHLQGIGASLLPDGFIHPTTPLSTQLGDYLFLIAKRTYTFCLNTLNVKMALEQTKEHTKLMAFTQFVNRQKAEGTFQSIAQSQADFIRKHRIRYL
ncbi:MAG: hypothetical protein RML94_16475, partial [Bacteroidia bacterium]|nr:hypothetical protein [Bacteroidia bacterium]